MMSRSVLSAHEPLIIFGLVVSLTAVGNKALGTVITPKVKPLATLVPDLREANSRRSG